MNVYCVVRDLWVNRCEGTKIRGWLRADAAVKDDRGHLAVMPIAIVRLFLEDYKAYLMRSDFRKIICGKNWFQHEEDVCNSTAVKVK